MTTTAPAKRPAPRATRRAKPTLAVAPDPPEAAAPTSGASYALLPLDSLVADKRNPRRNLGEDLEGLADSIKAVGIVQPLVVEASTGSTYIVLAGHRRLAAARRAGLTEAPCIVREASDDATRLELALVENLQREDLEPLDEAEGYKTLVGLGLSQRAIAERVGRSQSHVSKRLALLELPKPVLKRVESGTLPLEAAAALVRLKDHPAHLKKAAANDPSGIPYAVEVAEKQLAWEAKVAELRAVATEKGWPVVEDPGYAAKRPWKTLAHWNGPPELDLDAKAHASEPCHAVMVPRLRRSSRLGDVPQGHSRHRAPDGPNRRGKPAYWSGYNTKPTATSVCTDPARHGKKGDSALKAKAPPAPARRTPSDHEVAQKAEAKERKAAAAARALVLTEALSSHRATRGQTSPRVAMCLRALVDVGRWEAGKTACDLLGMTGLDVRPAEALERFAGTDDGLHKAALAVALARVEQELSREYSSWADEDVLAHFALLADMGYEPSAWEKAKLDKAAAELAAARAEEGRS